VVGALIASSQSTHGRENYSLLVTNQLTLKSWVFFKGICDPKLMQLPPNLYRLQHSLTQPKVCSVAASTGSVAALESHDGSPVGQMEVFMFDRYWTWIIRWARQRSRARRTLNSWTSDRLFKLSLYWHSLPQNLSTAFENNFRISSPSQPAIHQYTHTHTHTRPIHLFKEGVHDDLHKKCSHSMQDRP